MMNKPAVVGLGNVGIGMTLALVSKGHQVTVLDLDKAKIDLLESGSNTSAEPQLDRLLQKASRQHRIRYTTDYSDLKNANPIFVTVGSPSGGPRGLDTRYAENSAQSLGKEVISESAGYLLIVLRTTIPIGFTRRFAEIVEVSSGRDNRKDFGVCYNPENLAVGNMIQGILEPDFIMIGEMDKVAGRRLESFYHSFHKKRAPPIFRVGPEEAEIAKLCLNAFLSAKITLANSVADICSKVPGVDAENVLRIIGADSRINPKFIKPGMSYGGQCFPKDMLALISTARSLGAPTKIFEAVRDSNELHKSVPAQMASAILGDLRGKTIAVLGIAYKAGISDTRGSPSLDLINALSHVGARVKTYDPSVKGISIQSGEMTQSLEDCLAYADCCIIATAEPVFENISCKLSLMRTPIVIDCVRLLRPGELPQMVQYRAIGLGSEGHAGMKVLDARDSVQ